MNTENTAGPSEKTVTCKRTVRYSYSKDFLLSLAHLEICNRRPDNLDPLISKDALPDVGDGGIAIQASSSGGLIRWDRESDGLSRSPGNALEWRRQPGSPGQHGPRRGELLSANSFGSARQGGELSNQERPARQGSRRENKLGFREREKEGSGSVSNQDGDVVEAAQAVRPGSTSRQQHDGLLGSGGGLRPSLSAKFSRSTDFSQGSGNTPRANDKPLTLRTAKEDVDSINDETFGFEEISVDDRSEKERKRKEAFVLLRIEQRRLLEEQQKAKMLKSKEQAKSDSNAITDRKDAFDILVDDVKCSESLASSPGTPHAHLKDSFGKELNNRTTSVAAILPVTPRPLVPPGFNKAPLQKSNEVADKGFLATSLEDENDMVRRPHENLRQGQAISEDTNEHTSRLSEDVEGVLQKAAMTEESSKCILEKLFKKDSESEKLVRQSSDNMPKEISTREEVNHKQGFSKFAEWFQREDKSSPINSTTVSSEALLIDGKMEMNEADILAKQGSPSLDKVEEVGNEVPNVLSYDLSASHLAGSKSSEDSFQQLCKILGFSNAEPKLIPKAPPVFVTCEDLEQSILAQAEDSQPGNPAGGGNKESSEVCKDENASAHLLRLLQKQESPANNSLGLVSDAFEGEGLKKQPETDTISLFGHSEEVIIEQIESQKASTPQTLELLFGEDFMNELRSSVPPVSGKPLSNHFTNNRQEEGLQFQLEEATIPSDGISSDTKEVTGKDGSHRFVLFPYAENYVENIEQKQYFGDTDDQSKNPVDILSILSKGSARGGENHNRSRHVINALTNDTDNVLESDPLPAYNRDMEYGGNGDLFELIENPQDILRKKGEDVLGQAPRNTRGGGDPFSSFHGGLEDAQVLLKKDPSQMHPPQHLYPGFRYNKGIPNDQGWADRNQAMNMSFQNHGFPCSQQQQQQQQQHHHHLNSFPTEISYAGYPSAHLPKKQHGFSLTDTIMASPQQQYHQQQPPALHPSLAHQYNSGEVSRFPWANNRQDSTSFGHEFPGASQFLQIHPPFEVASQQGMYPNSQYGSSSPGGPRPPPRAWNPGFLHENYSHLGHRPSFPSSHHLNMEPFRPDSSSFQNLQPPFPPSQPPTLGMSPPYPVEFAGQRRESRPPGSHLENFFTMDSRLMPHPNFDPRSR